MPEKPWGTPDEERDTWTGQYPPIHIHGIYPWSILDTRTSEWKARRKYWDSTIADGTKGRDNTLYAHGKSGYHTRINGGRSAFDPVLTELMYSWYAPARALIYDPFAGGVTRGAVAHSLGHVYTGVDINPMQVDVNLEAMPQGPTWVLGDGTQPHVPAESQDMILTCPPYHNVEKYTDNPLDLSRMSWDEHLEALAEVMEQCYTALRDDRYMVWVTGDLRDSKGHLRGLHHHTARIITQAGFHLVNEHILLNAVGTRHRMLRRWWSPTRSAGRLHQHVIVAVKGDRRRAADTVRRQPHC